MNNAAPPHCPKFTTMQDFHNHITMFHEVLYTQLFIVINEFIKKLKIELLVVILVRDDDIIIGKSVITIWGIRHWHHWRQWRQKMAIQWRSIGSNGDGRNGANGGPHRHWHQWRSPLVINGAI